MQTVNIPKINTNNGSNPQNDFNGSTLSDNSTAKSISNKANVSINGITKDNSSKSQSNSKLGKNNDNSGGLNQTNIQNSSNQQNNNQSQNLPTNQNNFGMGQNFGGNQQASQGMNYGQNPNSMGFGGGMNNPDPWNFDPWGSDSFGGNDSFGSNSQPAPAKTCLTPQERVKMIEEVYKLVLNREPDTRDINYYKYSTLDKNEIIAQLLDGKEHKQVIDDGRGFKKMKDRAEQAEIRSKLLQNQIQDQLQEFKELTNLLEEKNRQLKLLRQKNGNPYNFSENAQSALKATFVQQQEVGEYTGSDNRTYLEPEDLTIQTTQVSSIPQGEQKPIFVSEPSKKRRKEVTFLEFLKDKIRDLLS